MKIFIPAAALVVALDQWTKYLVKAGIQMYEGIWVIKGFFRITHIENSGIAFGMLSGLPFPAVRWILVGVISLATIGITIYWARTKNRTFFYDIACGLIAGGAIGNLIDRIRTGRITDFLEFGIRGGTFPVFNAADSAVTVGVILFILHVLNEGKAKKNASGTV